MKAGNVKSPKGEKRPRKNVGIGLPEWETLRNAAFHKHKPMGNLLDDFINKSLAAFSIKK